MKKQTNFNVEKQISKMKNRNQKMKTMLLVLGIFSIVIIISWFLIVLIFKLGKNAHKKPFMISLYVDIAFCAICCYLYLISDYFCKWIDQIKIDNSDTNWNKFLFIFYKNELEESNFEFCKNSYFEFNKIMCKWLKSYFKTIKEGWWYYDAIAIIIAIPLLVIMYYPLTFLYFWINKLFCLF